ncbi:hypothetical protein [Mammaliicoccus lentus]|nr:hypothetical protein [Mammaliicoccus lentus]MBF0795190.1 hypothetical protein [Mammaliicoccus lentus]
MLIHSIEADADKSILQLEEDRVHFKNLYQEQSDVEIIALLGYEKGECA